MVNCSECGESAVVHCICGKHSYCKNHARYLFLNNGEKWYQEYQEFIDDLDNNKKLRDFDTKE